MLRNLFLMEMKIYLLNQARSELMKQEHEVESLNSCINELQQQAYAQRLATKTGATTRRNSHDRKARRQNQIRSMHEMGEMKRAITNWRILCTKVEKKSWNHTEAHFTSLRSARKDELFEWFWRIPRSRVELLWNVFTRSRSNSKDSKSAVYAQLRQTLETWNMESTWTTGKRFWKQIHVRRSVHYKYLTKGLIHLWHQVLQLRLWRSCTLRCWTRRLLLFWTRSSKIPTSRRMSVSENRKLSKKDPGFYEGDRSPSWSATTVESLVTLIKDGTKIQCRWQEFQQMTSWKVSTHQGYESPINSKPGRHGDSSEDIDAWLSKIEDDGWKEQRSETSITKLWRQAWENWNRRSGQESEGLYRRWRRSGEKKASVRKETQCSFRHESNDRAQRPTKESNGINWRWKMKRYMLPVEWKGPNIFEDTR